MIGLTLTLGGVDTHRDRVCLFPPRSLMIVIRLTDVTLRTRADFEVTHAGGVVRLWVPVLAEPTPIPGLPGATLRLTWAGTARVGFALDLPADVRALRGSLLHRGRVSAECAR